MEENISIKGLLELCRRRTIPILLTLFSIVSLTFVLTTFVFEPKYEYSKQIMVGGLAPGSENDLALSTANTQLIRSYMDIINNPIILESVIKELKLNISASSLREHIEIKNNENSQIVTITVSENHPQTAEKIAALIALRSKEMMKNLTNLNSIQIVDQTGYTIKSELVFPKPLLTLVVSFLFGLITALCLAIILDGFDTTIKNEQELRALIDVPHIGSINARARKQLKRRVTCKRGENFGVITEKVQVG